MARPVGSIETPEMLIESTLKQAVKRIKTLGGLVDGEIPKLRRELEREDLSTVERLEILSSITDMMRIMTSSMSAAAKLVDPASGGMSEGEIEKMLGGRG